MEWARVEPILPGIHYATVTNIQLALGAASGMPMLVWEFRLDSGPSLTYYTSRRGRGAAKAYEAVRALGLDSSFKLSDCLDLRCRVRTAVNKNGFPEVTKVMPDERTFENTARPSTG